MKQLENFGADLSVKNESGQNLLFLLENISDNETNFQMVRYLIQNKGIHIITDKHGQHFWQRVNVNKFKALLQEDLMSFYSMVLEKELVRRIRSENACRAIKVVSVAMFAIVVLYVVFSVFQNARRYFEL